MGLDQPIDITTEQRKTILALLARHLPNTSVWVYGSRVKWTSSPKSDLDLVVFARSEQTGRVSTLREAFEESNLPFRVDLFVWDDVPEQFRKQIEAERVVWVEKEELDSPPMWKRIALGEIVEIFDGPHATPKKTERGPIFLGISNLVSGRLNLAKTEHLSEQNYSRWTRRVTPRSGDVVFSYETRLGEAALIPTGLRCCLGRRMGLLRPKGDKVDSCFLLYAFLGTRFQETLRSRTVHGSTVDRIPLNEMGGFPIDVPRKLEEQRAIAHVLATLDDKIELKRQMNQTLEAMARALFKSWFVDFHPVHAKATLKHPATTSPQGGSDWSVERARAYLERMAPDIAALFPDSFVGSELGPIPEGWKCGVLDDVVELLSGGTPKTSVAEYWDGNIPWYTAKDAPSLSDVFVLGTERSITQAGVENSAAKILPAQTTIVTARGTVGRLACLGRPMAMNQTCYGIRGARGFPDFFTYWNARMTVDELRQRTHGTIFDTITRQTFTLVNSIIPPVKLAVKFEKAILPVMRGILSNLHESASLAAQRATLLPKLMSGEVRIRDVTSP